MSDLISIGSSAIEAYQKSLTTVSNNIANMATEGYSRETTTIQAGSPQSQANIYFGTGAFVQGVVRAYSEFATANVRSSASALNTQGPLVELSNRVIDVMGNQQSGLASALDSFFSSARDLSASPASMDARGQFLRSADSIATRFRSLSGELSSIEADSRVSITNDITSLNSLGAQLAVVNSQLMRTADVKLQPPALLDQRDQLLSKMANLAAINVTTLTDGEVLVGLGSSARQGLIVDRDTARAIAANFSDSSSDKVDIRIDPYGTNPQTTTLSGGTIAGTIAFRQQVLEPAQTKLDTLAQVFATGVNQIQTSGIDSNGNTGKAMFALDPVFISEAPTSQSDVAVTTNVVDPAAVAFHDLELRYDETRKQWSATDLTTKQVVRTTQGGTELTINGTRLTFSGTPQNAETITMKAFQRPAAGLRLALSDGRDIATGALFRAIGDEGNVSLATATVNYQPPTAATKGPLSLDKVLVNNPNPTASVSFTNTAAMPVQGIVAIPAGFANAAILLDNVSGGNLDLQVVTRDGRQLLGTPLDLSQQQTLLTPGNGFATGATYSAQYLNKTGTNSYRQLDLFYGVQAQPGGDPAFDAANNMKDTRTLLARIDSQPIANATGAGNTVIAANALTINGQSLSALTVPAGGTLQATDVANWINSQVPGGSDIHASATTETRIAATSLRLGQTYAGVTINGQTVGGDGLGFASADDLVSAINAVSGNSHVVATLDSQGALVLANTPDHAGEDIQIGTPPNVVLGGSTFSFTNALGVSPKTVHGSLHLTSTGPIRLGIGTAGSATDLANLGLRTGAYINGTAPEDLLVFATGTGTGAVAANYQAGTMNTLQDLRGRTLDIAFTSAESYTITDVNTGTVLAERTYDPQAGVINYSGLTVSLSSPPAAGDRFRVDGNQDGIGNNQNLQNMVALEKSTKAMPNGRTLGDSYNDLLSSAGNVASQATIAQQAMTVVNQQAIQARDQVSGVNLDTEAADLIRFQQAYQAAARSIQTASQLFDSIVQIH